MGEDGGRSAESERAGTQDEVAESAESAVISCLLTDIQGMEWIHDTLTPDMFSVTILGEVYSFFRTCYEDGKPADYITTMDAVATLENKSLLGMMLARCIKMDVMSHDVRHYADTVVNRYMLRRFTEITDGALSESGRIEDKISKVISGLEILSQSKSGGTVTMAQAVDAYSETLFTPDREQGIKIGFDGVDRLTGGLHGGNMCIIAARPSVGKSAFAVDIALRIAGGGKRVGLYSLEMTNEQVYNRMLAHESGIDLRRITGAQSFLHGEEDIFDSANARLRKTDIILCDELRTVSRIQAHAKKYAIDVVIIDYAQLLRPESNYRGNRTAEVGQISHSVKNAALKLKIPIILLAQLNRASLMTKDKEPTMGELRESGDFEQDADIIMLLWNKDDSRILKGLKVDKARQGRVGKIELEFDGAVMRFKEKGDNSEMAEKTPFDAKVDW